MDAAQEWSIADVAVKLGSRNVIRYFMRDDRHKHDEVWGENLGLSQSLAG
jgi:hypothetical protein